MYSDSLILDKNTEFSQVWNNASSLKMVILKLLLIMVLLLHTISGLSKNNDNEQPQPPQIQLFRSRHLQQKPQFRIIKITRLKFGQDQFLLNNTNVTNKNNNKNGGCGISCSTMFDAYYLSESCKCSCPRGVQTFLIGENRCEKNEQCKTIVQVLDPIQSECLKIVDPIERPLRLAGRPQQ